MLVRAHHDRLLDGGENLWSRLRALSSGGKMEVKVPRRQNRPGAVQIHHRAVARSCAIMGGTCARHEDSGTGRDVTCEWTNAPLSASSALAVTGTGFIQRTRNTLIVPCQRARPGAMSVAPRAEKSMDMRGNSQLACAR